MTDALSTPLDVLLRAMRLCWQQGHVTDAAKLAKVVAPYVHAKPSGARSMLALSAMGDEELDELCKLAVDGDSPQTNYPQQLGDLGAVLAITSQPGTGASSSEDFGSAGGAGER